MLRCNIIIVSDHLVTNGTHIYIHMQYACRKTLADSRPRVRGRFAKNDDFGEVPRPACSNHEEDDDDEVRFIAVTKLKHP